MMLDFILLPHRIFWSQDKLYLSLTRSSHDLQDWPACLPWLPPAPGRNYPRLSRQVLGPLSVSVSHYK